jgi:hypothetical protein
MDFVEIKSKEELLSKYSSDYSKLKGIVNNLDKEILDFVPDLEDAWSIREHIAHLVDTEIRAFIRYRNSIVNRGIELNLGGGDVNASNRLLKYSSQNMEDSLEVIRLLRKITVEHVSGMSHDEMEKYHIKHPDLGETNLKMILSIYTQHFDMHIDYLQRNVKLFNERRKMRGHET